jgi:hypothetical protein
MDKVVVKKNEKKITSFQKNEENPFLKQAVEEIENHIVRKYKSNSGSEKKGIVVSCDTDTGEIFKTSFIRQIEVDDDKFAKLFLSNFSAFFDLSQAAIRVFGYILTCLKPKSDTFIFRIEKAIEYTKYETAKPIYKGLEELLKGEVIARGPIDSMWFINPLVVFNGDRVSFTKAFVRKKADEAKVLNDKAQLKLDF